MELDLMVKVVVGIISIGSFLGGVVWNFSKAFSRIEQLEKDQEKLKKEFEQHNSKFNTLLSDIAEIKSDLKLLNQYNSNIEKLLSKHDTQIEKLQGDIVEIKTTGKKV